MSKKYTEDDVIFIEGCFDHLEFETQEELDSIVEGIVQAVLEDANTLGEDVGDFLYVDFDPEFDIDEELIFTPDTRILQ